MIEDNDTTPAENPSPAPTNEHADAVTHSHAHDDEPEPPVTEPGKAGDSEASSVEPDLQPGEITAEKADPDVSPVAHAEAHREIEPIAEEPAVENESGNRHPELREPAAEAEELLPTTFHAIADLSGAAEHATPRKKPRKTKTESAETQEPDAEETPHDVGGSDAVEPETLPAENTGEMAPVEPIPALSENKKKWYAVKIQSGREESIKAAIERKIKIEGLEEFFGQLVIPVEELIVKKKVKVKNKKTGETTTQEKNVAKYNKKFPGYLFAEVEFNDEILYVFRETSGVGDFVGASLKRAPAPMTEPEVQSMLTGVPDPEAKKKGARGKVVVKLDFEKGDKVRIRNGAFAGNEGEVKEIKEAKDPTDTPKVTVEVTLWGRPVPVDLDYWEVDKI